MQREQLLLVKVCHGVARRLRYQGRFDDARLPARVTSHDLRNALDDLLAGREVRVPITRPFGCSLDLVS